MILFQEFLLAVVVMVGIVAGFALVIFALMMVISIFTSVVAWLDGEIRGE